MAPKQNNQHAYEKLPHGRATVWRYLSLPKFISLLRTKSIFLCRADQFEDAFEGSFTEGSLKKESEEWGTEFPASLIKTAQWIPCRSFVSCWHASPVESAALWRIYGGTDGALAIRTTISALQQAFPSIEKHDHETITTQDIRRVQYIDYRTTHPYLNDLAGPLCYKRKAFSYEQEIRVIRQLLPTRAKPRIGQPDGRAIIMGPPPLEIGIEAPINVEELIKAVYIAPSSPKWLLPTVRATIDAFGFHNMKCRQSSLDDLPEYGPARP